MISWQTIIPLQSSFQHRVGVQNLKKERDEIRKSRNLKKPDDFFLSSHPDDRPELEEV
jgi:hypothetical protein